MTHPLFFRQIISRINTIKSSFILLYFKVVKGWSDIKNPFHFHNQLLKFLDIVSSLSLYFPFYFHNQLLQFLAPKVPINIIKNPPFFSFVSFLITLVTYFNKILESSRAWTIFIMSFISSFEVIKVVVHEPCVFFLFLFLNSCSSSCYS